MRKSIQRQGPMLVILMAVLTLTACAQLEIADRAVAYNKAVENASNRMLVLNIIRANKRYPLHFTEIVALRGDVPLSQTLGFTIPFGGDAASTFIFSPSTAVKSGISFDMAVLNEQDFMRGITSPVTLETFEYYLRQGWPKAVLFHVFVREIRLKQEAREKIGTAFNTVCPEDKEKKANKSPDKLCEWARAETLAGQPCGDKIKRADVKNEHYVNAPTQICRFLRFQNLFRKLRVLDMEFKIKRSNEPSSVKTITKSSYEEKETRTAGKKTAKTFTKGEETTDETKSVGSVSDILKFREDVKDKFKLTTGVADAPSETTGKIEVLFWLRSVEAMIYYLGEVTRVQNGDQPGLPPFNPKVVFGPEGKRGKGNLFQLRKKPPGAAGAAVIVSHEGDTYHIPREKYGTSMQILALISKILATHKKREQLPGTLTVRTIGG
ncbi:MAG: hypothetical protein O7A64_02270 [Alphaproteobacteria bacterium]|nr:hypothetical protein [Alphaproteobacteria bacterium]